MLKFITPIVIIVALLPSASISGQNADTTSKLNISGYVDAYAAYYTDSLNNMYDYFVFQKFPTVSPRTEQFGLNIAQLSAKYNAEKVRATITLHYGDIPMSAWNSNYHFIQEANAGFRICNKLWFDAGYFRTHIGAEGLYPKENITSSISIPTWYEPYDEAGFKFNYLPTEKITLNLYLLNGYNMYIENNRKFSFGLAALFNPSSQINFGYTNYIGDDSPAGDTISHLRIYNNLFVNYETKRFKLTAGLDVAMQQHSDIDDSDKSATAVSGLMALRHNLGSKTDVYVRGELFRDPSGFLSGVFIPEDSANISGLMISGLTLGFEYKPTTNSYVRLEGRQLIADPEQKLFYWDGENTNKRFEVMMNVGVWFD